MLGETGWRTLLAAGIAVAAAPTDPLAAAVRLRKAAPDETAARRTAALELVTEGRRLAAKLGTDEQLLAVRGAVEQATRGRVATWHAHQVPESARLLEIGCGCGGDTLALAHRAANLIAVDTDPVRAACTHHNLMTFGIGAARALPGDGLAALEADAARADVVFADPDRRPDGPRRLDPEAWSPALSALRAVAATRTVLIKAAPSIDPEVAGPEFRVRFVSHRGECCEAFLSPRVEGAPDVAAVLLPDDGPSIELAGDRSDCDTAPLGDALYVPDPAVVRASLVAELAGRHQLGVVDSGLALLTGAAGVTTPWLASYHILEAVPLQAIRAAVRSAGAGSLRTHCRGVRIGAEELARDLRGATTRGGPPLDVFAMRSRGRFVGVLAARVTSW